MDLSLNWIKKYVSLDGLTPDEIALKLTMATAEVEEVKEISYNFDNIFIAEIVSASANNHDAKLKNVVVDLGGKKYKTVCSAPNVHEGLKSVFALSGAIIDGKPLVAMADYKGFPSEGMLLSVAELGMSDSHSQIIEVPQDVKTGTPLKDLFPEKDYLIEIDNKSLTHRPDLWGHYGFARELAAVYKRELLPLKIDDLKEADGQVLPKVKIEDYINCPRYSCIKLDNLSPVPSPMWLQYLLLQAGCRPINLPVDLTNFISLEIGQPMHAFDGEKIDYIKIGQMGKASKFITLDDVSRDMLSEDLMIFDANAPVAIAGIMGGESTEVSDTTSKITLESANFYSSRIRKTSSRLNLRTDASQRFEKSQPHSNTVLAIKRFVCLAKSIKSDVKIISGLFDDKDKSLTETHDIIVDKTYMLDKIGENLSFELVKDILTSLEFKLKEDDKSFTVSVPSFRSKKDVSIPEDIIEEIARVYGYDNLKMKLPSIEIARPEINHKRKLEHQIKLYLAGAGGMNEVMSYAWYDEDWCKEISYNIPESSLVLKNYTAENLKRLRTELVPNILKMCDTNSANFENFAIFEMGKVYKAKGKNDRDEHLSLCLAFVNREKNVAPLFMRLKGLIRGLFMNMFNAECEFVEKTQDNMLAGMEIYFSGKKVGYFAAPGDDYLKAFRKGVKISFAELNVDILSKLPKNKISFKEPNKFPGSWLDFSLVSDKDYACVVDILSGFKNEYVISRDFISVFQGKGLEDGFKSYTFRYGINYKDHTPSGDEIQSFKDDFIAFAEKHSMKLR
jgi:phenylalanyl-tRNA synthetase beta chain